MSQQESSLKGHDTSHLSPPSGDPPHPKPRAVCNVYTCTLHTSLMVRTCMHTVIHVFAALMYTDAQAALVAQWQSIV